MKNILFICVLCFLFASCSDDKKSVIPVAKYHVFTGSPANGTQFTTLLQDGNIAIVSTQNSDSLSVYIANPDGSLKSKRVVNLSGRIWASSIVPTPDNGFMVCGFKYDDMFFYYNVYVMKFNNLGDTMWSKTYVDNGQYYSLQGRKIIATKDNNYLVFATATSSSFGNLILMKINPKGDTLWSRQFSTSSSSYNLFNMMQTSDGNYLIQGQGSSSYPGMYMMKVDNNGNWVMENMVDDTSYNYNTARYSMELPGGDLLMCYNSNATFSLSSSILIRADANGHVKWQKRFADNSLSQILSYAAVNRDGGYTLVGTVYPGNTGSVNGSANWVMRTDASGNLLWSKKFRGEFPNYSALNILKKADDGNIISGSCGGDLSGSSQIFITQMDANGNYQ